MAFQNVFLFQHIDGGSLMRLGILSAGNSTTIPKAKRNFTSEHINIWAILENKAVECDSFLPPNEGKASKKIW
jgi:hypothetical protein